MVVLTRNDFGLICRKAVEQMGDHPAMDERGIPRRLDSFVGMIDSRPDLTHPSFNANYSDYVDGRFYSRNWQAAGADSSAMRGAYPMIMLEQKQIVWGDNVGAEVDEIVFLGLDKNGCDGCPPETVSPVTAYDSARHWLKAFFNSLNEVEVIRVYNLNDTVQDLWLTHAEAVEMKAREEITDFKIVGQRLAAFMYQKETKLIPWSDGALAGVRGYYAIRNVRFCENYDNTKVYTPTNYNRIAVQNCDSCA